jgi:uroporphyrinogen decarboxylase
MGSMTALERSLRVINHQLPDRIPVIPQAHNWIMAHYGARPADLMWNGTLLADLLSRGWQDFGWDGVFVGTDSVALAHALGMEVEYTDLGPAPSPRGLLKNLDEVDALQIPDLHRSRLQEWITATRLLAEQIGGKVMIIARGDQGPFTLAGQLRGMEQFLLDVATGESDPALHRLLDFCTRYWLAFADCLLEAGAHVVTIGDALASGSLISPAAFEKYAFPYQQELARAIRSRDGLFGIHVCGNTNRALPRLAASGAHLLEFDAPTDFGKALETARGQVCLLGNVDTSAVMVSGTPQDVEEECRWRIEKARPGCGFILSTGCAISPNVPEANLRAMIESAHKYGKY